MPYFPKLEENNIRKGFFEHSDYLKLRDALPDDLRPVLMFASFTGCRKEEILGLRWDQVDLGAQTIQFDPGGTKNGDARVVPLAPELYEMPAHMRASRDLEHPGSLWVFSRDGERIRDFRAAWEAACTATSLADKDGKPTKLFHDLRRTGVRNLIRSGVSESAAMRISGHRTRAVFERYNIVTEKDLRDAVGKMSRYLQPVEKSADKRQTGGESTEGKPETPVR